MSTPIDEQVKTKLDTLNLYSFSTFVCKTIVILRLHTFVIDNDVGHELFGGAVFPTRHEPLQVGRVRVTIDVHQERGGHQVRSHLRLLVEHCLVGVSHQRSVVCVEEQFLRHLQPPNMRSSFYYSCINTSVDYQFITIFSVEIKMHQNIILGQRDMSLQRPP